MVKICAYCGRENTRQLVANPRRCPFCGNPYDCEPQRELRGRFTSKFKGGRFPFR